MSDTPVVPLPPSYNWGFVVGRSISAMADTIADPDRFPEARGSNGRVTFTPHTRYKKEVGDPTAFVQFEVVTARIVDGNVVDAQGEEGIYLISGAYKVAFTIDSGSIPGFDILVTPDHTLENPLDLVTASPFVPEVGTPVTTAIIPAGAAEDQVIAWRNGRLVWVNGASQAESAALRAEEAAEESRENRDQTEAAVILAGDWSGAVDLSSIDSPATIHAKLVDSIDIALPNPSPNRSMTITLVLSQENALIKTLNVPNAFAPYGLPLSLSEDPSKIDLVHFLWDGIRWWQLYGAPSGGLT